MTTTLVFRDDWYARATPARVLSITERGAVVLDRSVFYPTGGGQPGDSGSLLRVDGSRLTVATAAWDDPAKTVVAHVLAEGVEPPSPGETLSAEIDWEPRLLRMRMHTALHLLSVALPFAVTGGSIGDGDGRLDFDMAEAMEREEIQSRLDALLAADAAVTDRWITDAELDANPGLVKTMKVQPPRGAGRVRLVEIAGIDLQPCGGTHVRRTGEIDRVEVTQVEKKGKQNRRVRLRLA